MIKFCLCLLIACFGSSSILWAQVPKKGLVAHYLFNADAQDISKNANHGYTNGGVFATKDRFGNACGAMQFNGSDGYITVPHSKSLSSPQSAYTVALWFKALDGSEYSDLQWMTICCKSDIREETNNSPQFRLQSTRFTVSMNTDFTENFDHKIEFNRWYHYAVTYDGSYCRVYLNGNEIVNWAYKTKFAPNELPLEIGRDLPGNIEYFCGVMDDLYIYDRALNLNELTAIYTNDSERTSPKPCGQDPSLSNTTKPQPNGNNPPPRNQSPKQPNNNTNNNTSTTPNTNNPQNSTANPVPNNNSNNTPPNNTPNNNNTPALNNNLPPAPNSNLPLFVGDDTIEYQQTVVVEHPDVKLLFYDAEKEDGDIVSVNFNGVWVLERHYLKRKSTRNNKSVSLHLLPNAENYLFTKAWNLGSIPPNTLTVEIIDPKGSKPPRVVNIKSDIGRSGAIRLIYKP